MREIKDGEELMPDVVVAESIWWNRHTLFSVDINQLVSDEEDDRGGSRSPS